MSHEIEQIEARLTAYIDGQLPEKDRTEIEAYLASNPTHARLITELQRQRAQVRTLPREIVPVEIMDHLQAHLERHALLADVDTTAAMRINRWPQLGAIAAVLLLAVGLGVLVYQVLPNGSMKPEQMVMAPPSVQQLPQATGLSTDSDTLDKDGGKAPGTEQSEMASKRLMVNQPIARAPDGVERMADEMAAMKTAVPAAATTLPSGLLSNSSAIVVSSDDPIMTRSLVATYLAENGYTFGFAKPPSVPDATPLPTTEPDGAMSVASLVQQLQVRHDLPTTLPGVTPDQQPPNLIVVRDVQPEQLEELRQAFDQQREGHQQTQLVGAMVLNSDNKVQNFEAAQQQELLPQNTNAMAVRMRAASTQPLDPAAGQNAGMTPPTTQATQPTAQTGDVLIVVLAKSPVAVDRISPASMPTTLPAPLPEPPPKPVPMIDTTPVMAAPSTTQPTAVPAMH